jgi:hypothetical protein
LHWLPTSRSLSQHQAPWEELHSLPINLQHELCRNFKYTQEYDIKPRPTHLVYKGIADRVRSIQSEALHLGIAVLEWNHIANRLEKQRLQLKTLIRTGIQLKMGFLCIISLQIELVHHFKANHQAETSKQQGMKCDLIYLSYLMKEWT